MADLPIGGMIFIYLWTFGPVPLVPTSSINNEIDSQASVWHTQSSKKQLLILNNNGPTLFSAIVSGAACAK
jgi:hypothetical protein